MPFLSVFLIANESHGLTLAYAEVHFSEVIPVSRYLLIHIDVFIQTCSTSGPLMTSFGPLINLLVGLLAHSLVMLLHSTKIPVFYSNFNPGSLL